MSAIEYAAAPASEIAIRKPRITVAQLVLRAVRRWQRSRAINELSLLDDRQLEDIGVSRNDIPRVVDGLFGPDEIRSKARPQAPAAAERARVAALTAGRAG
ncbi:MAG: DUF1127 domain-containing protein [Rhizobiaceae bacterium]|nr:DUF1127 domain-containing protein [Rhizobiaceae bacterium]